MKEIEIKARLVNGKAVVKKLKALGCTFEKPVRQEDVVYAKFVDSLKAFRTNDVFLRIRVKGGRKILFTIKKRMLNDLDALEHEVEVDSKEEMEQAILMMGYKEAIRIDKKRTITHYHGCEICIDEVKGLGNFIEMEKLAKDGNSEKIQEELFTFFESLGISRAERVFSGYDVLTLEKKEKK